MTRRTAVRLAVGVAAVGLVVATTVLVLSPAGSGGGTRARLGFPAPATAGSDLDGRSVSLDGLRGRSVVVNFWASWCDPCRAEFPLLRALRVARPDIAVLGVAVNDAHDSAAAFARDMQADWPSILDREGKVAKRYGLEGLPWTFVVDRRGVVRARHAGELHPGDLERMLAAAAG